MIRRLRSFSPVRCALPLLPLLLLLYCRVAQAADPPPMSDYEKRVAAALYAVKGGTEIKPESIDAKAYEGLTRYPKEAGAKEKTWALNFGGIKDGVDTQGTYQISIGEELADWTKRGFTALKRDSATGAEIYYMKKEGTGFQTVRVRRAVGGIQLSVAQRRPLSETQDQAVSGAIARLSDLFIHAQKYKLFLGEIKMTLMSFGAAEPELPADTPWLTSLDDAMQKEVAIRIQVQDPDGMPVADLKHLSFQFFGSQSPYVRLRVGERIVEAEADRFIIEDPGLTCDVTVILPQGNSDAVRTALYQDLGAGPAPRAGLRLRVGAALR